MAEFAQLMATALWIKAVAVVALGIIIFAVERKRKKVLLRKLREQELWEKDNF